MKKFQFKLQAALNLRYSQEEAKKADVARAQQILREEQARLEELERLTEKTVMGATSGVGQRLDLQRRQWAIVFLDSLKIKQERQQRRIQACEADLERAQAALFEVIKERKILEKLRERHVMEYQKEVLREEQKLLDEMATNTFFRREYREG